MEIYNNPSSIITYGTNTGWNFATPNKYFQVTLVSSYVDSDIAGVKLKLVVPALSYEGIFTGNAMRHPTDEPDQLTAQWVAYSRAFAKISAKLEKLAAARVKHADDNREANVKRRERELAAVADLKAAKVAKANLAPVARRRKRAQGS